MLLFSRARMLNLISRFQKAVLNIGRVSIEITPQMYVCTLEEFNQG